MNNEEKIKIGVDIEGNAIDVLGALKKELRAFEQNLKRLSGIGAAAVGRGTKSRGQDDAGSRITDQLAVDRIALRGLRERMSFQGRMTRQRLSEEGAAARAARRTATEAAKTEESRVRTAARNVRYLAGLHRRYQEQQRQERETLRASASDWGRSAIRRSRDVGSQVRRSAERTAVGAAVVGGGAMRKVVRSEADVDASEVDARIYGGLSRDAARKLRNDWAAPLAEQLGSTTSRMLSGFTEALKVSIPNEGAKAFSGLAVKTSEAWGLDISDVTDTLGTINQILTSAGDAFNFDKFKSVANSVQYLSAKQATTPGKLVEYLKRGAGGAQVLGMSQEAGLAFGSASTSLGNRAGSSGELMDFLASRVIELPKLAKRHGMEAQDARRLASVLGYGSADAMDRARRRDPDSFLPDLVERFAKIKDPKKKDQAIRDFAGREWMGEFGRIVTGHETYKEAVKLQREAKSFDAIEEAWALHTKMLSFIGKQLKAGFLNFLGEFGQTLTPFAEQIRDYFLAWSDKLRGGGIGERFKAAIGGFIEGLGFKDLPNLLEGIFGKPGQGDAGGIEAWRETFRGFGAGIRDIADAVKRFFSILAGANAGTEELGRWAGRFVALGAALIVLSPVITILSAFASGVLGLAAAIVSGYTALKLAGLVGGATAGARAGALAGGATAGGAVLPLAGGALATDAIARWFTGYLPDFRKRGADGIRDDQSKGVMGSLWSWMIGRGDKQEPASKALSDLPPELKKLNEEIEHLRNQLDGNAKVQRQSFDSSSSLRSMTQNAALSGMRDDMARMGGLIQLASFGGGLGLVGKGDSSGGGSGSLAISPTTGALLSGQQPGQALGNVGIGRRGIIGGSSTPTATGKSGGSRAWRNSNPGNIKFGAFASSMGATHADDKGFAVFPDYATGRKAQERLLFGSRAYAGLTVGEAIQKWAPASDGNDPKGYAAQMAKAAGVAVNTPMASLTPDQRERFLDAQQAKEGWTPGNTSSPIGGIADQIRGTANHMRGQYGPAGSNLTTVTTPSGKRFTVHQAAAESFTGFARDLEASGYQIKSIGGYNHRNIRGGSSLSQHAYGNAIDINPAQNPMGYGPLKTDLPANVSDMAAKWGLSWGGDWKRRKDAMHFEWTGRQPWKRQAPEDIVRSVPNDSVRTGESTRHLDAGTPGGGGGGNGGGAPQIIIQGHNGDPEALANAVQRRLRDRMERRTHEVNHQWG